jgi:hypothetical protein
MEGSKMTQVLTSAREADRLAEANRVAWNLPRPRVAAASQDTLDWYRFLARYFPGGRRHDFKALAAYGAHRSSAGAVKPSSEAVARADEPQLEWSAATPEDAWEDDGGSTPAESDLPSERGRVRAATS